VPVVNRALAPFDLRARSYAVLALACSGLRPTQSEIAGFMQLDPSQVVALVDELEKRGLVARQPHAADRRSNALIGTDAGRVLYAGAKIAAETAQRDLFSRSDSNALRRLTDNLRDAMFPSEARNDTASSQNDGTDEP
jgi:DNA-binding MarR family transcriptional regulator